MKYKVGDKVKIREDLKAEHLYGNNAWVTQKMHNLRGKIAHITEVTKYGKYCIDLDNSEYLWVDEMFEDTSRQVVINVDGNKVIARRGDKYGVARCHPDDDFDFYTGAKLALDRLEEEEKPYAWLKKGVIYYSPSVNAEEPYIRHIYDADRLDKIYMKRGIAFKTKEEAIECAKKMLAVIKQGD